jgi:hypothetical protein
MTTYDQIIRAGQHPITLREVSAPTQYKFAIIKHRWRTTSSGLIAPPDTCPFNDLPTNLETKGTSIPIRSNWWRFIKQINNPGGYEYARSIGNMIINTSYDQDAAEPQPPAMAESIGCGGNFIAYDKEINEYVRIVSYNYLDNTDFMSSAVQ